MRDLYYRKQTLPRGVVGLIHWWNSDRVLVHFAGTGWMLATPIEAFELRIATLLEF